MSPKDPMPLPKMQKAPTPYRRRLRPIEWATIVVNAVVWAWAAAALVLLM